MEWIVYFFLLLAVIFNIIGTLGIFIFPDVYTRLQASSIATTTSVISVFIASMLSAGISPITGKIFVIFLFFFISSPISTHIIALDAWNNDILPWRKMHKIKKNEDGNG